MLTDKLNFLMEGTTVKASSACLVACLCCFGTAILGYIIGICTRCAKTEDKLNEKERLLRTEMGISDGLRGQIFELNEQIENAKQKEKRKKKRKKRNAKLRVQSVD